ncbi:hypothetical protein FA13DRAFT_115464 [Coprinellus micaceus]|uniref:Uncharacterized protein n=1 Tax=Coprinellus micaceus TaxID=71717 RepID=A0A4Y7TI54_COPMI|nr:hypothetical protein FA13DRAFT_115464 [Coprinellus micaceus]
MARGEDSTSTQDLRRAPSHENLSIFVECPGFNNPWIADTEITAVLQSWFQNHCSKDVKFGGILYFYDTWGERLKHGPLNDPPPIVPSLLRDSELGMRFTVVTTKWDMFADRHSIDLMQEKKNLESTRICNVLKPKRNAMDPQGASHYIVHSQNNSESARKAVDRLLDLPPVPLKRLKILRPTTKVLSPVPSVNPEAFDATPVRWTLEAIPPTAMARSDAPQTGNDYYRTSALEPKPPTGEVKVKFPTIGAPLDPTPMSSRCSSSTPSTTHFTSSPPTSLPESLVSLSDTRRRQATPNFKGCRRTRGQF